MNFSIVSVTGWHMTNRLSLLFAFWAPQYCTVVTLTIDTFRKCYGYWVQMRTLNDFFFLFVMLQSLLVAWWQGKENYKNKCFSTAIYWLCYDLLSQVSSWWCSVSNKIWWVLKLLQTGTCIYSGRRGGLMVSELDSGSSGPGSSPGRGQCVVFLGKTLNCHSASLHPGV